VCTAKGCIDLSPQKSIRSALGPEHRPHAWLTTYYGVFAAAFPGFVLGYATTPNVALAHAPEVYGHVLLYAGVSYGLTAVLVRLTNAATARVLPVLAALAAGLYYWFTAPTLAAALGLMTPSPDLLRGAALLLIGIWLWKALSNVRLPKPSSIKA
jgi:hypothetical protein